MTALLRDPLQGNGYRSSKKLAGDEHRCMDEPHPWVTRQIRTKI